MKKKYILPVLILFLAITLPVICLAIVLLCEAENWNSRLFVSSLIVTYFATLFLFIAIKTDKKSMISRVFFLYILGGVLIVLCYFLSPTGFTQNSHLQSFFPTGQKYIQWSPANLVSEIDQIKLGAFVISRFKPFGVTSREALRFKNLAQEVYHQMQDNPEFISIGSTLHYMYTELLGFPIKNRHLYVYIPQHSPQEKLPVILFLHGSFGNLKGYLWCWKILADKHHFAIVAPSFGFGRWHNQESVSVIEQARQFCVWHPTLDEKKIILAGLSSGGIGVSQAAQMYPDHYQGLLYISAVVEANIVNSPEFVQGWRGRPIFIIHGDLDERIPKTYIEEIVSNLSYNGLHPVVKYYNDEDHFLLFSKRLEVMTEIYRWTRI